MVLYDVLKELGISYIEAEHEAVFTVEQTHAVQLDIPGIGCKNLLLNDRRGENLLLVILREDKHADTKAIARFAGTTRLSFATPEKLMEVLHLIPGSVSPLGIVNDTENRVKLLLDADLVGKQVIFHPNTNTKSLSLHFDDLIRFIEYLGHSYTLYPTDA